MSGRVKLIEIELSRSLEDRVDLGSHSTVRALVRLQGNAIGWVTLPVWGGCCSAQAQAQALFPQQSRSIAQALLRDRLLHSPKNPPSQRWNVQDWLPAFLTSDALSTSDAPLPVRDRPSITVIVCPQFSTDWSQRSSQWQVLENSPEGSPLEVIVLEAHPDGWNAARNFAIQKAQGELIAFTDDRMEVDQKWISAVAEAFRRHPEVSVVTGLVIPQQLENETQALFDRAYGFNRGFQRKWLAWMQAPTWMDLGTMQLGMGGNWAARRSHLLELGGFDLGLDVPKRTETGGHWDLWSRTLLAGRSLLYEPAMVARYLPPSDPTVLQQQLQQTIAGFYGYIRAGWVRSPHLRWQFLCLGLWKFVRLCMSMVRNYGVPRPWIGAELRGLWQGLTGYNPTQAAKIPWQDRISAGLPNRPTSRPSLHPAAKRKLIQGKYIPDRTAVRQVNLNQPLQDITGLAGYDAVRVYVWLEQHPIGWVELQVCDALLGSGRLATAIGDQFLGDILALSHHQNANAAWASAQLAIAQHWTPVTSADLPAGYPPLPLDIPVTVIITTCDRPQDLQHCLQHLVAQKTARSIEIIVADNRPASGLSKAVVDQFPQVKYVAEPRPGGSYGRNAAFVASTGAIVVTVDDDVTVPPDWLEKLIAPMIRPEVMVVTGNVLPLELETPAQWMFETLKGGLGAGFNPFEADRAWWDSFQHSAPPVWKLGVSANAAFRATIFSHPAIGMMDEILGPGTPTVGGEENHLIYKVLRAGYTVVYEPSAQVWHRHRRDLKALYKQVYGHMKGGTAYHLLLWLQEKDPRGWKQLFIVMPRYLRDYVIDRMLGKHQMPWRIMRSEISGYLAGFWGYWQSAQRLKRLGRSDRYIPVEERDRSAPPITMQKKITSDPGGSQIHLEPVSQESQCP